MLNKLKDLHARLLRRQAEDLGRRIDDMWSKAVEAENAQDQIVYRAYVSQIEELENKRDGILRQLGDLPPTIPMIPFQPNR